jgi:hypothetical protein
MSEDREFRSPNHLCIEGRSLTSRIFPCFSSIVDFCSSLFFMIKRRFIFLRPLSSSYPLGGRWGGGDVRVAILYGSKKERFWMSRYQTFVLCPVTFRFYNHARSRTKFLNPAFRFRQSVACPFDQLMGANQLPYAPCLGNAAPGAIRGIPLKAFGDGSQACILEM